MLRACDEHWNGRLSAYLDGEGAAAERLAVEKHLQACDACRALAELYRCDAQDAAAALARPAGPAFADRVMAEVAVTPMNGPAPAPPPRTPARGPFSSWLEWGVVCLVIGMLSAVLFPTFAKAREKSRQSSCINNVRQQVLAVMIYLQEHEERFPAAESVWQEINLPPKTLLCNTTHHRSGNDYGYNVDLGLQPLTGPGLPDPPDRLVIADSDNTENLLYSEEDIAYRHSGRAVMGYADGHVTLPQTTRATTPPSEASSRKHLVAERPPAPTIVPPEHNYGLADKLMIAYTASLKLHSPNVDQAMERTETAFRFYEGFVLSSDFATDEKGHATAVVKGRVPAAKLGQFLVAVDGFGTLVARTVNGEDLTAGHLANIEKLGDLAQTQRSLGQIGGKAKKTDASLAVEDRRENAAGAASGARVEEYKLNSRVTLAEVAVTITSPPKPPTKVDAVKSSASRQMRGLRAFGLWLLTAVLIPLGVWLPVWGPVAALVIVLLRRRKAARAAEPPKTPVAR